MRTLPERSGGPGVRTQPPNAVRRIPHPRAQRAILAWSEHREDNPADRHAICWPELLDDVLYVGSRDSRLYRLVGWPPRPAPY